jgi:hypothetical protein
MKQSQMSQDLTNVITSESLKSIPAYPDPSKARRNLQSDLVSSFELCNNQLMLII